MGPGDKRPPTCRGQILMSRLNATASFRRRAAAPPRVASIERQCRAILVVGHAREVVTRIDVPRLAEEELIERFRRLRTWRPYDATECDLDGKSLRPRDGHQLEVPREGARPVRNEVVLRESDVGVTARDHFGDISMGDAEAAGELLDLFGEEGVGGRPSDQPLDRSTVAGAGASLDRIRLCDPGAGSRDVGQATNAQGIALADEQGAPAIAREVTSR